MPFFEEFEMQEVNIRQHFIKWLYNRPPLVKDYLWDILNFLLSESAKQSGLGKIQLAGAWAWPSGQANR